MKVDLPEIKIKIKEKNADLLKIKIKIKKKKVDLLKIKIKIRKFDLPDSPVPSRRIL